MKNILVLGAGTAGTAVANRVSLGLPAGWAVTVVDPEPDHLYQPDLVYLPFGLRKRAQLTRPRESTLRQGVRWVARRAARVDLAGRRVVLTNDDSLDWDLLVVATGSRVAPDATPGMLGREWRLRVHEFYTSQGARALATALRHFQEGRLLVSQIDDPVKGPLATIEFALLAEEHFRQRGIRHRVEIAISTPGAGLLPGPTANRVLRRLLRQRGIRLTQEFPIRSIDDEHREVVAVDGRRISWDLLVAVPCHLGARFLESSALTTASGFVSTEPRSLLARGQDHVYVLGDAAELPIAKVGSAAHFAAEVVARNVHHAVRGDGRAEAWDGHANTFLATGRNRALFVDYNYDVEPLPGLFPAPGIGPLTLLRESRRNHWGRKAFRWLYWNALLPGRPLPLPSRLSLLGKHAPGGHLGADLRA